MLFFFFFSSNICTRSFTFIRFNINISGGKGGALVRQSRLFSFFFSPFEGSASTRKEVPRMVTWMQRGEKERDDALAWGETETTAAKKKKMHRDEAKIRELRSLRCFPLFSWFYLDNSCRLREYIFFLKYVCCFFSRCLIMSHFFFFWSTTETAKHTKKQRSEYINE